MRRQNTRNTLILHGVLIASALLTVFPLGLIALMAFKTNPEIFANPLALPGAWRWDQIGKAWTDGHFGPYYLNSLRVAVPTVLMVVVASTLAAYGLVFGRLPGARYVLAAVLLGLIVPLQAIIVALFHDLGDIGLLNSLWGLSLAQAAVGLPFGIFMMRSFLLGIPKDLIEAARLDGAGDLTVLRRVVLPLATAPAMTLATLQFMYSWNDFLLPLIILHDPSLRTVTLGLFYLQGGTYTLNYAMISAGVLITAVPIMVVFFVLQRQFIAGVTAGAVK
jgi:ABC-type glycerol-3-phosphate transport system permease component